MSALSEYLDEAKARADLCEPAGSKTVPKKLVEQSQQDVPMLINIVRTIDIIFQYSPSHMADILTTAEGCCCDVCNVIVGMNNRVREGADA